MAPRSIDPAKPPTLASIARKAGVSHATVSLVLNERGKELRINPDTASRIRQIAREVNYTPNQLARGLRGKRTQSIGVLWSLCGPHPSQGIARTITMAAQTNGHTAHLVDSLSDPDLIVRMLADLARRRVDGVVAQLEGPSLHTPAILDQLAQFPAAVIVSSSPLHPQPMDTVVQDHRPAFREIVGHLLATGRRRVAFLGNNPMKVARLEKELAGNGHPMTLEALAVDDAPPAEIRPDLYRKELDRLLPSFDDIDAVVCNSDEAAAGLIAHLRDRAIAIPRQVAVIGFNDSPFASVMSPSISSVKRHDRQVAQQAVDMLFERLKDPSLPPRLGVTTMHFVVRESSADLACGQAGVRSAAPSPSHEALTSHP